MSDNLLLILTILLVAQRRYRKDKYGYEYEQVRVNPWNPLSWVLWVLLCFFSVIVFGFKAVNDEDWFIDQFKWR